MECLFGVTFMNGSYVKIRADKVIAKEKDYELWNDTEDKCIAIFPRKRVKCIWRTGPNSVAEQ